MTRPRDAAARAMPRRPDPAARRLAAGAAVVVLLALAAWALLPRAPAALPPVEPPAPLRASGPAPPAPPSAGPRPGRPRMAGPGWRVVATRSIADVLVVEVETTEAGAGAELAARILGPAATDHVETLVYFRRPGQPLADTRVQWTPAAGWTTLPLR